MRNATDTPAQHLLRHGIKPSAQRVAILGYLMTHRTHPAADEIHRALVAQIPTLSRSTVYSTLWLMADAGAIDALGIDRSNARFDYSPAPHAHLQCRRCGAIIDMPLPDMNPPAVPEGADIDSVSVTYHGLCAACSQRESV